MSLADGVLVDGDAQARAGGDGEVAVDGGQHLLVADEFQEVVADIVVDPERHLLDRDTLTPCLIPLIIRCQKERFGSGSDTAGGEAAGGSEGGFAGGEATDGLTGDSGSREADRLAFTASMS